MDGWMDGWMGFFFLITLKKMLLFVDYYEMENFD